MQPDCAAVEGQAAGQDHRASDSRQAGEDKGHTEDKRYTEDRKHKKTHVAPEDGRAGSAPAKKTRTDMPEFARTGDATRDKCVEMFYSALMVEDGLDPEHAAGLAGDIERALLFAASGRTVDARYKATFRSKYLNLKDRANPDLRQSVLYGGISVERFLGMSGAGDGVRGAQARDRVDQRAEPACSRARPSTTRPRRGSSSAASASSASASTTSCRRGRPTSR